MMSRLVRIAALAALALAACSRAPEAQAPAATSQPGTDTPHAELQSIGDDYIEALAAIDPLFVYFGFTDVRTPDHAAMTDNSPDAVARFRASEDALLDRLGNIDPQALARADWVTWQSLKETLEASVGQRVCESDLWDLNHMSGWHTYLADVAREQPVGTEEERAAALVRWSKLPKYIQQERAYLEEGLSKGYSAPKSVVRRVIGQFDSIIAAPLEQKPFYEFVTRAGDHPEFKSEAKVLFESEIVPALTAWRDFLRDDYLPAARVAVAIKVLPKGAECYEALLRSYHSAEIGAERTYQNGLETVAANTAAVIERGKAMFGESDFTTILERINEVPENRFTSEEELIEQTRALVPVTREKVAPFFTKLPAQELIVEPYPEFLRGTGQASRYEQKPESEGPAIYRIATDDWETQTRGRATVIVVHEGWPGHHLQIAMARGIEGLHPAIRLASSGAFIEGWARYSEALAEEAGIYEKGYGEITRRAWPARGMVMDPGLHLYDWTREQAVAYALESGNFTPETAEDLVDRIAVWPGQLTAYDTGGLEIFALREQAEEQLGEAFDLREFHDRILGNGALPLGALREQAEAWIAEEKVSRSQEVTGLAGAASGGRF
jgi:uncharacterized protein (DUF885 family)